MRPSLLAAGLLLAIPALATAASKLTNVSVRTGAGSGADTLIVGFNIAGTGNKPVLIRGVGPTLASFGVGGTVMDPELRLFNQANAVVAANDDWDPTIPIASASALVGAFALPAGSADAVLLLPLTGGSYSAHVGAKSGAGTVLVELYDTDPVTSAAEIANLSARSVSGTGGNVLTVGFGISGDTSSVVLIRAIGPSLGAFGVTGTLSNPRLQLFGPAGPLISNDDWVVGAGWDLAGQSVGAFSLANGSRDSALLVALPPGVYTVQAAGVGDTTGVALVEVYVVKAVAPSTFVYDPVGGTNVDLAVRTQPVPTFQARPAYPFDLRRAGQSGEAVVDFVVDVFGRVVNAFVLRATHPDFGTAAVAAVTQWQFQPGRNARGVPVPVHFQVPIVFTIN